MSDIIIVVQPDEVSSVVIPSNSNTTSLSNLSDVSIPSPQEGQVLTFKTGLWKAEDVVDSSIKSSLDGGVFM